MRSDERRYVPSHADDVKRRCGTPQPIDPDRARKFQRFALIPLIGYFPMALQPDEGLTPDVKAAPTIVDIRDGRDNTLETALAFVRR